MEYEMRKERSETQTNNINRSEEDMEGNVSLLHSIADRLFIIYDYISVLNTKNAYTLSNRVYWPVN